MRIALPAALFLAACASVPTYGPADTASSYGYRERPIEEGRYRVSYRARDLPAAEDGALRRAAELTLTRGETWFTVVSRAAESEGVRRSGPSIGLGGSTGGWRGGGVGVGVSLPIGGGASADATVYLEVLTGSGPRPEGPETYDAAQVAANVGP